LTDAGLSFYEHCVRIIDDVSQAESSITNKEKLLAGRIRIAAPLSFGLAKLSPLLQQFNELHPQIEFDIDLNNRHIDLAEEGVDLAIRIAKLKDSSLIAKRLTTIQLLLCASPAYLTKYGEPTKPHDLMNGHIKLNYHTEPGGWRFTLPSGGTQTITVPSVMKANNGDFLCQAAIAGKGIVLLPDFICSKAIESGLLKIILPDQIVESQLNVYAVYPHNKHQSQRVKNLISFLFNALKSQ